MAENTLIEVIRGKLRMQLPFKSLVGEYAQRLEKVYKGAFEISDPNLREKLTADEYAELAARYDYLVKPELPPEPPLLDEVTEETQTEPQPKKRGRKPKQTEDAD
jgi:hypothetical protein